ncbi:hypothetical protein SAMN04488023_10239 [Pedobacter rhizosphaerae]|uniref:Uncharacterized protein n=2 Tax=Pedobacter rhizosphaerae TaxID=390241 RepID=A0A1H9JQZ9_9SPHI|nr:hypothetical protein SAMN04488023_10239 [Pedobacter rhizosphaerae]
MPFVTERHFVYQLDLSPVVALRRGGALPAMNKKRLLDRRETLPMLLI